MKKQVIACVLIVFAVMVTVPLTAVDIFSTGWEFHLIDDTFFYPNYIADPFSPAFLLTQGV